MSRIEGARVLVVDDDDTIRAVVRRLAEIAGAQVTEAESGEAALRALYDLRPDIVVLDIDLPGLDGWQVLERMRQLTDIPVVMLSAHDDELEKVRALQAGADDYVTKPFGPTGTPPSRSTPCTPRRPCTTGRCPSRRASSGCSPHSSRTRAAPSAPSSSSTSRGTTPRATRGA
jgi:CheY-like chemotaxis protein